MNYKMSIVYKKKSLPDANMMSFLNIKSKYFYSTN